MLTQCPHCSTVYPIESDQFLRAGGLVRCGVCEREFDALERLQRQPVETDITPRLDPELAARQGDLFAPPKPPEPVLPGFLRERPQPDASERRWWLGAAGLALLLSAQMLLSERATLALDPRWRSAYQFVCDGLGCDLPAWREPQRWSLLSRDIAPHPSVGDALLVTASVRNDARWAQPLPLLELSMADIDGNLLALRRFTPGEFLDGYDGRALAPGQTASIRLELEDPGKTALAFAFEFR